MLFARVRQAASPDGRPDLHLRRWCTEVRACPPLYVGVVNAVGHSPGMRLPTARTRHQEPHRCVHLAACGQREGISERASERRLVAPREDGSAHVQEVDGLGLQVARRSGRTVIASTSANRGSLTGAVMMNSGPCP